MFVALVEGVAARVDCEAKLKIFTVPCKIFKDALGALSTPGSHST
jgi:hypothetical protein